MKQFKMLASDRETVIEEVSRSRSLTWVGAVSGPMALEMASNLEALFPDPVAGPVIGSVGLKPKKGGWSRKKEGGGEKTSIVEVKKIPKLKTFTSAAVYTAAWTNCCADYVKALEDVQGKLSADTFDWARPFLDK